METVATVLKKRGVNPYKLLCISKKNLLSPDEIDVIVENVISRSPQMEEDILLCRDYFVNLYNYKKSERLNDLILDKNNTLKEEDIENVPYEEYVKKRDIKVSPEYSSFLTKNNKFMKGKFNKIFEEMYKSQEKEEKVKVDWSNGSLSASNVIFADGEYIIDKDNTMGLLSLEESGPKIPDGTVKKEQLSRIMEDFNLITLNKQSIQARMAINDFLQKQ